jgi:hypothetical protein
MNLSLISRGWAVLKAGREVANPTAWKQGQVTVNAVTAFIAAALLLLKGTKYDPKMDDATIAYIAGGIYGVVNWLCTVVSTDKIGFTGRASVAGPAGNASASEQGPLAAQAGAAGPDAKPADPLRAGPDPANPTSGYLPG